MNYNWNLKRMKNMENNAPVDNLDCNCASRLKTEFKNKKRKTRRAFLINNNRFK